MAKIEPSFIDLNKATVRRDDKTLLEEISLKIRLKEHAVILGPNGAGKSSLIKLMTGEYRPLYHDELPIKLFGQADWDLWQLRNRVGLVSNDLQYQYSREVTGLDTIISGYFGSVGLFGHQRITAQQRKKALKISKLLGLEKLNERIMSTLSSGEARRFLIGRALVNDPEVIVLDEPTNSLDIKSREQLLSAMRSICQRGHTLILVTHTIEEIIPEIDRVILIKKGRIFADGPKQKILNSASLSELFEIPLKMSCLKGNYRLDPR